jgi:hypothetical protein
LSYDFDFNPSVRRAHVQVDLSFVLSYLESRTLVLAGEESAAGEMI